MRAVRAIFFEKGVASLRGELPPPPPLEKIPSRNPAAICFESVVN